MGKEPVRPRAASTLPTPAPRQEKSRVIEARDVTLTFETADGAVHALSQIDLAIEDGEFVSLIGPSGCGKTTLLRIIADLEQPTGGTIRVNGLAPAEARIQRQYGYVFQAPALYPWRTVEKNVMLPLEIMGFSAAERSERARRNLKLVNLQGFERKFPWQLSGGMQQRASIARALSFDPRLLLMDEPFGALDEIVRDNLNLQLLKLWQETHKTVVFVTHSIPEAVFLFDPHRRHVAAAGTHHRRHRKRSPAAARARHPRNGEVPRRRPASARGPAARSLL